jgi:hypothetical protein
MGQAGQGNILFHEEWFDQRGNKTAEIIYSTKGKPEQKNEFDYDEEGNLLRQKFHFLHEDLIEESSWKYDQGKVISKSLSFGFGDDEAFDYIYDAEGNLKSIHKRDQGIPAEEFSYENGLLVKHIQYDEEGQAISETKFSYDDQSRKTEEQHRDLLSGESNITRFLYSEKPEPDYEIYTSNGKLKDKHVREYEGKQVIRTIHETFLPDYEYLKTEFTYLPDGNQESSRLSDKDDQTLMETHSAYNEHGLIISEHRTETTPVYGQLSFTTHFEYAYHEQSIEA